MWNKISHHVIRILSYRSPLKIYVHTTHLSLDSFVLQIQVDENGKIIDARFKTFGCGSAIASSSLATEWVKGKSVSHCDSDQHTHSQCGQIISLCSIFVLKNSYICNVLFYRLMKPWKSKTQRLPKNFVYHQSNYIALVRITMIVWDCKHIEGIKKDKDSNALLIFFSRQCLQKMLSRLH